MTLQNFDPILFITNELNLPAKGAAAVVALLKEGNTIPFIARYRKEVTGNLDEVNIRQIQEKFAYITELMDRKETVLSSIQSQGKLTPELHRQIENCFSKTLLEDLYLPYKPKRRTRAMIAREKGLEPLALRILEQPKQGCPIEEAKVFIDVEKGILTIDEALAGARDIVAEILSENAEIRAAARDAFKTEGVIVSKVIEGKEASPTKYEQYYNYHEKAASIPSHRYLAIRRGEKEEVLQFHIEIEPENVLGEIRNQSGLKTASPYAEQLEKSIIDACKRLIFPSVETDLRVELKMQSDRAAVDIFASNLRNLLLSSPLGTYAVIGIDPGLRTGCKCAVVNNTGKFLHTVTIYPTLGERELDKAEQELMQLVTKYQPHAVAIGNGTGGRETEQFVRKVLAAAKLTHIAVISVNESGASVYSASDIAREEFPDLDLTIRGAISIARRLQDPLAELVKIDPKSIGVGQYQHDVYQSLLQEKLGEVVESCVNHVGVELNTASAPLLAYVAGIGPSMATKIVKHREINGPFKSRQQLLNVTGLGPRTYEQAAGFIRVRDGEHPLDASAVHPERYTLVALMAKDLGVAIKDMIANESLIQRIDIKHYISEGAGALTIQDIINELKKPGRDPRAHFEMPCFRDDVHAIKDLKLGMKLEGIVTNVAAFGVFVDIGVHQDGLIHISELTDRYIKDPAEVVSVGQKIKVKVLAIDVDRKRISLTAKVGQHAMDNKIAVGGVKSPKNTKSRDVPSRSRSSFGNNPFANL
jgi:uncharacterized protein